MSCGFKKLGKQQKEMEKNGKKCESKVLAILLKQFALQKSFINMTKAKQYYLVSAFIESYRSKEN